MFAQLLKKYSNGLFPKNRSWKRAEWWAAIMSWRPRPLWTLPPARCHIDSRSNKSAKCNERHLLFLPNEATHRDWGVSWSSHWAVYSMRYLNKVQIKALSISLLSHPVCCNVTEERSKMVTSFTHPTLTSVSASTVQTIVGLYHALNAYI